MKKKQKETKQKSKHKNEKYTNEQQVKMSFFDFFFLENKDKKRIKRELSTCLHRHLSSLCPSKKKKKRRSQDIQLVSSYVFNFSVFAYVTKILLQYVQVD